MAVLSRTGKQQMEANPGEIVSVLGAPGSGKSCLALELAFLQRPSEGEVLFHGKNPLSGVRKARRPREVTLLVQNAEDQLFARSVFDDVAFGPRHLDLEPEDIEDRVVRALESVRLDANEVKRRSPFALSGGERRRVALAGVLAMEPEVLILDEPTANLDPRTRNEFLELLAPLRGEAAVIWLTASAREAALADRVYLSQSGVLTPMTSGPALLENWRELAAAGVELPSVYELAAQLDLHGYHLPSPAKPDALTEAVVTEWRQHGR